MIFELQVNRNELAEGLKKLRKLIKPRQAGEAILSFESGLLMVELGSITVQATAEGLLRGLVRVSGKSVLNLAEALPANDPLLIKVETERLHIGGLSLPCIWHDADEPTIGLPMDAPLTALLGVRYKYTEEQIFRSGLTDPIAEAEARRKMLTCNAANKLEPLGVRLEDVERLVDESLRRANKI